MTTSTHTYSAILVADPDDIELTVVGGQLTMDVGASPHIQATLTISYPGQWVSGEVIIPGEGFGYGEGPYGSYGYGGVADGTEFERDVAAYDALDPRLDARIIVGVRSDTDGVIVAREFDLGLRERQTNLADGTITLTLASNEAMVDEYGPAVDDETPRDYEEHLIDICDYVITEANAGSIDHFAANGDADVSVYWEVTNLIRNPNGANTVGTANSIGTSNFTSTTKLGSTALRWENDAGDTSAYLAGFNLSTSAFDQIPVVPGLPYHATALVSSSIARDCYITLHFRTTENTFVQNHDSAHATTSTSDWTRFDVQATAPHGAAFASIVVHTQGNTAGQFHYSRRAMIYQDTEAVPNFDGDVADGTNGYTYEWSGTPDDSTSSRIPIIDRPREALIWRVGQSGMDFLIPLLQANGLRLVCDENQLWTIRDENWLEPGSTLIEHAVNMTDLTDTISRDDGSWFDAAATTYTWTDRYGTVHSATDIYAPPGYSKLQQFDKSQRPGRLVPVKGGTPYPGDGFSEYAVRRAEQRGRILAASTVSNWETTTEQTVTIDYADGTQEGKIESVSWSFDDDEMTVTARTVET